MRTFFKAHYIFLLIPLIGSAAMGTFGCSGESHHKSVNFSKTIDVPSPDFEQQTSRHLIVNRHNPIAELEQLRGKTFAITDPDSNTGSLVPRYWLATMGEHPASFFGNSIMTVAR